LFFLFSIDNAEILEFDIENNDYCKIYRCYGGTYRAPEEFECMDSHEAIDTYAMGNNIYCLLTGLWPFYQYDPDGSDEMIQELLTTEQARPYVDPRYRTRSVIEGGLVQIMEQCWEHDLDKRLSIFRVVQQLYDLRHRVIEEQLEA